ncbi:Disease resistance protein [Artemisia annua]|uniref:Disease resistance protein n=1 Tax=Artemisia annua TaxID=35608 RepID=A0A2U1MAY2_ARTAN|nr:Disease resistance protein [Artemisia annua]
MADPISGAAIGALFSALLTEVINKASKPARFRTLHEHLKITLTEIEPRVDEMSRMVGNRPEEAIRKLIDYLTNGKELVLKCSTIQFWNVYQIYVCVGKLKRLDKALRRFFQEEVPMKLLSTNASLMNRVDELKEKVDRLLAIHGAVGFPGSCGVPGLPEVIVGFDHRLAELKYRLLKDDTKVLVISAPGGCGKTTLAKMLCHDKDIKDVFGQNILYLIVSRQSSLKSIALNLFRHYGKNDCVFQTEEDAKNQIENLMREMGPDNILLVLDDVWSESESIVQQLRFQIPGYKIMVTSRFLLNSLGSTYELSLLNHEDARTLFCHSAFSPNAIPDGVPDDDVNKMVEFCKGFPLAHTAVGASLCRQPLFKWKITLKKLSEGQSILQSDKRLLHCLKTSIDALDEFPISKNCFLDLGAFPEDKHIADTLLMDMWAELYNDGKDVDNASEYLLKLSSRNLVNLVPIRKYAVELQGYENEHYYVTQHDVLRELAIHISSQEPISERKQLFMEIHGNEFPKWWTQKTEQPINARILSISTDETFSSSWNEYDLNAPNVEVLILNIRSKHYSLPQFIRKMSQLKVLVVTGYGTCPTQLDDISCLGSSSSLRCIRFEHICFLSSVHIIFKLRKIKKLTFVTCKIGDVIPHITLGQKRLDRSAFSAIQVLRKACNTLKVCATKRHYTLPNLTDLEFDRCYDLKNLPAGLGNIAQLQNLSITNCHELDALPEELGSLSNLKTLSIHSCTKLQELPESTGSLQNLQLLDISDCLSINVLPQQIGELSSLRVLQMSGCQGLHELPESVSKLLQLKDVICDEETSYLWKNVGADVGNVKITVVEKDILGSFMKIIR